MVPATKNLSSESAAYKLRTAWVNGYLNNPAMFHGVMYAASANLDLINGEHDNPVTNFHRAEAIRLVQRTISFLEPHDELPLAVLAATWALAHVAVRHPSPVPSRRGKLTQIETQWKHFRSTASRGWARTDDTL